MLKTRLPLWYQVAQSLRSEISYRSPDDLRLPTEAALSARYGVSLVTIRQALKSIEDEGLVSRHRRRGTFINPGAISRRELKLLGSIDSLFAQQASEATQVLDRRLIDVPAEYGDDFGPGAKVMMFKRLRCDAGQPVSYAINYVRAEIGKCIQKKHLRRASMSEVIRDTIGCHISKVEDTVEADMSTPELSQVLDVELISPILKMTGKTFDEENRIIDIANIYYRGDKFKFAIGFYVDENLHSPSKRGS